MTKRNIVIAGGGFAGVSALKCLSKSRASLSGEFEIILIDKKPCFEFIPMLPDIIGGWLKPENLRLELKTLANKHRCEFINSEITGIDFSKRKMILAEQSIDYEYLLISTGSETNFFGNENAKKNCYKLDNVSDAITIRDKLLESTDQNRFLNNIIIGGGYTGIEIATNMHFLLEKQARYQINIIDKGEDILAMVPEWMKKEVKTELEKLSIKIIPGDSLKEYDGTDALLESGTRINDAFCVWVPGVKTASYLDGLSVKKERSRIMLKEDLRIHEGLDENVFVAGDSGHFFDKTQKGALRMAVMFAMGQGRTAAHNIVRSITKKDLLSYKPVDLGYIIPMAHGEAPGIVLGRRVSGRLGYLMHYLICVYRSEWKNKAAVFKNFISKKRRMVK